MKLEHVVTVKEKTTIMDLIKCRIAILLTGGRIGDFARRIAMYRWHKDNFENNATMRSIMEGR